MATGDQADMMSRLRGLLPPWFPEAGSAPVIDAILSAIANGFAFVYQLLAYAGLQTRIKTATDAWIDLIAWDYFGSRFLRFKSELDAAFKARVLLELVRPRVTRAAIAQDVQDATGTAPRIIEPWRPTDVGVWDSSPGHGLCFWDVDTPANPFRWTNTGLKYAVFIEATLPPAGSAGGNAVPALDEWTMAYDTFGAWIDITPAVGRIDRVYAAINATRAAGITAWVKFVPRQTQPSWDQAGATWDQPNAKWQ